MRVNLPAANSATLVNCTFTGNGVTGSAGYGGAVYLDNRKEGALFSPDDLRFLEAFADRGFVVIVARQLMVVIGGAKRRMLLQCFPPRQ